MRLWMVLALVAGCKGGDEDPSSDDTVEVSELDGFWPISKETFAQGSCQGRGSPVSVPTPLVKLEDNGATVDVTFCATETSCPPVRDWTLGPDGAAWVGEAHDGYLSEQEGHCILAYRERTMELVEGELTLSEDYWVKYATDITGAQKCEEEIPQFFGTGGQCTERRVYTASRSE